MPYLATAWCSSIIQKGLHSDCLGIPLSSKHLIPALPGNSVSRESAAWHSKIDSDFEVLINPPIALHVKHIYWILHMFCIFNTTICIWYTQETKQIPCFGDFWTVFCPPNPASVYFLGWLLLVRALFIFKGYDIISELFSSVDLETFILV